MSLDALWPVAQMPASIRSDFAPDFAWQLLIVPATLRAHQNDPTTCAARSGWVIAFLCHLHTCWLKPCQFSDMTLISILPATDAFGCHLAGRSNAHQHLLRRAPDFARRLSIVPVTLRAHPNDPTTCAARSGWVIAFLRHLHTCVKRLPCGR